MNLARVRPTRVYRFYRGGAMIDRLRGEPEQDGDRAEDWVASVVAANNPGALEPEAGLTRLETGCRSCATRFTSGRRTGERRTCS